MAESRILWLHAITPIHAGVGTGLGFVDLPIAREKTTNWPFVPGSGLKGVIWDYYNLNRIKDLKERKEKLRAAFGAPDQSEDVKANSGALVFPDAKIVCLPVRSIYGTFAWLTCPLALERLGRDLRAAGLVAPSSIQTAPEGVLVPEAPASLVAQGGKVYLADCDFPARSDAEASRWAESLANWIFPGQTWWQTAFRTRLLVGNNDIFDYFSETGTEVITRVHIDPEKGTVAEGQLWTEEALPAEAILASIVWCDKIFHGTYTQKELLDTYCKDALALQVGGKATVGRGQVRAVFTGA